MHVNVILASACCYIASWIYPANLYIARTVSTPLEPVFLNCYVVVCVTELGSDRCIPEGGRGIQVLTGGRNPLPSAQEEHLRPREDHYP